MEEEEEGRRAEEEEVSLGVIMTNTEIKFHILLFTLSSSSVSDMTCEKMSTLSSKPLNREFTSGSTSCLMENGHCILRREE
jgi:hypothetical protein